VTRREFIALLGGARLRVGPSGVRAESVSRRPYSSLARRA
jgi:hypothetical protein